MRRPAVTRLFALWLSVSLAVPQSAWALRGEQADETDVLARLKQAIHLVLNEAGFPVSPTVRKTPVSDPSTATSDNFSLAAAGMEGESGVVYEVALGSPLEGTSRWGRAGGEARSHLVAIHYEGNAGDVFIVVPEARPDPNIAPSLEEEVSGVYHVVKLGEGKLLTIADQPWDLTNEIRVSDMDWREPRQNHHLYHGGTIAGRIPSGVKVTWKYNPSVGFPPRFRAYQAAVVSTWGDSDAAPQPPSATVTISTARKMLWGAGLSPRVIQTLLHEGLLGTSLLREQAPEELAAYPVMTFEDIGKIYRATRRFDRPGNSVQMKARPAQPEQYFRSIVSLQLTERGITTLRDYGIFTVAQLLRTPKEEIVKFKLAGPLGGRHVTFNEELLLVLEHSLTLRGEKLRSQEEIAAELQDVTPTIEDLKPVRNSLAGMEGGVDSTPPTPETFYVPEPVTLGSVGSRVVSLASHPGESVVAAAGDKRLKVWNSQSGQLLWEKHYRQVVSQLAFHPQGSALAVAKGSVIQLVHPQNGDLLKSFAKHEGPITFLTFSPDGQWLASSSKDQTTWIWPFEKNEKSRPYSLGKSLIPSKSGFFSPDGKFLVWKSQSGAFRRWEWQAGKKREQLGRRTQSLYFLALQPDLSGETLVEVDSRGNESRVDAQTFSVIKSLGKRLLPGRSYLAAALSRDNRLLAYGLVSYDGTGASYLEVRDLDSWENLVIASVKPVPYSFKERPLEADVTALAFSADQKKIISGNKSGTVQVWEVPTHFPGGPEEGQPKFSRRLVELQRRGPDRDGWKLILKALRTGRARAFRAASVTLRGWLDVDPLRSQVAEFPPNEVGEVIEIYARNIYEGHLWQEISSVSTLMAFARKNDFNIPLTRARGIIETLGELERDSIPDRERNVHQLLARFDEIGIRPHADAGLEEGHQQMVDKLAAGGILKEGTVPGVYKTPDGVIFIRLYADGKFIIRLDDDFKVEGTPSYEHSFQIIEDPLRDNDRLAYWSYFPGRQMFFGRKGGERSYGIRALRKGSDRFVTIDSYNQAERLLTITLDLEGADLVLSPLESAPISSRITVPTKERKPLTIQINTAGMEEGSERTVPITLREHVNRIIDRKVKGGGWQKEFKLFDGRRGTFVRIPEFGVMLESSDIYPSPSGEYRVINSEFVGDWHLSVAGSTVNYRADSWDVGVMLERRNEDESQVLLEAEHLQGVWSPQPTPFEENGVRVEIYPKTMEVIVRPSQGSSTIYIAPLRNLLDAGLEEGEFPINRATPEELADHLAAISEFGRLTPELRLEAAQKILGGVPFNAGDFYQRTVALPKSVREPLGLSGNALRALARTLTYRLGITQRFSRRTLYTGATAAALTTSVLGLWSWKRWGPVHVPQDWVEQGLVTNVLGRLLRDPEHPSIRSTEATRAMTNALVDAAPDFLTQQRTITILYPGSGSHVTPLEIANQLIREDRIDRARYIYTEIDDESLQELEKMLLALVDAGLYTDFERKDQGFPGGKEVTFSVKFRGKPIEILFALNRSGRRYWRAEYAKKANVVYHHDLEAHSQQILPDLLFDFYGDGRKRGDLFVMGEDLQNDGGLLFDGEQEQADHFGVMAWDHIGTVTVVPHPFGHRSALTPEEEVLHPERVIHNERGPYYKFNRANLVHFNGAILGNLEKRVYSSLTDYLSVIASGIFDEQFIRSSARDASDRTRWLEELVQDVRGIIEKRLEPGSPLRAQWLLGTLRLYWAILHRSKLEGMVPATLSVGPWFTQQRNLDWLRDELPPVLDRFPALVEATDQNPAWREGIADYLIMATGSVEELTMTSETRDWIYKNISRTVISSYVRIAQDADAQAQLALLDLPNTLLAIRQIGRFGIFRALPQLQEGLRGFPDHSTLTLQIFDSRREQLRQVVQEALESTRRIEQEGAQAPAQPLENSEALLPGTQVLALVQAHASQAFLVATGLEQEHRFSRRDFLKTGTTAVAALSAGVAGSLPATSQAATGPVTFGDLVGRIQATLGRRAAEVVSQIPEEVQIKSLSDTQLGLDLLGMVPAEYAGEGFFAVSTAPLERTAPVQAVQSVYFPSNYRTEEIERKFQDSRYELVDDPEEADALVVDGRTPNKETLLANGRTLFEVDSQEDADLVTPAFIDRLTEQGLILRNVGTLIVIQSLTLTAPDLQKRNIALIFV